MTEEAPQLEFEYRRGFETGYLAGLVKAQEFAVAEPANKDPTVTEALTEIQEGIFEAWIDNGGFEQFEIQERRGLEFAREYSEGRRKGYLEGLAAARDIIHEHRGRTHQKFCFLCEPIRREMEANGAPKKTKPVGKHEPVGAVQ